MENKKDSVEELVTNEELDTNEELVTKKTTSKLNIDFFRNMAIGKKMLGIVSVSILIVLIVSLIIISNVNVIKENVSEISEVRMGVIKQVNDIQSTFSEMVININKYMNGFKEFDFISANQNLLKMSVYIKNAKEFVGDDEELADFKEAISQVENKIANLSEKLNTLKSKSSVVAPKALKIEGDIVSFRTGLDNLSNLDKGLIDELKDMTDSTVREYYNSKVGRNERGLRTVVIKLDEISAMINNEIAPSANGSAGVKLDELSELNITLKSDIDELLVLWHDINNANKIIEQNATQINSIFKDVIITSIDSSKLKAEEAVEAVGSTLFNTMFAAIIIALSMGLLYWFVRNFIIIPISHVTYNAKKIAVGDTDIQLKQKYNDEIGQLIGAFIEMADSIKEQAEAARQVALGNLDVHLEEKSENDILSQNINIMINNIEKMGSEILYLKEEGDKGNHTDRANVEGLQGKYAEILNGLNDILDNIGNPLNDLVNFFGKMAEGNTPENIDKDIYKGEFIGFMELVNKMRNNIYGVINEVQALTVAAEEGNLSHRADTIKLPGEYGLIVSGINSTLDALLAPVDESREIIETMAKGEMTVRVNGEYNGDHAKLKEAVNIMGESLEGYIAEISHVLNEIANSNLNIEIEKDYFGDFVAIKDSLNNIINQLNYMLGEIHTVVEQVESGSEQVAQSSQDLSQGAADQASSVQEISASMTQIGEQTRQNAINANKANEISDGTKKMAEKGNVQIQEMLVSMKDINESSRNISKIIKVIDEIAFQTNILALNAAVEAARAGEHGKGFAVVADEVRNLAGRSAEAAKETAVLIDDSLKKINQGTTLSNVASEALVKIVEGVIETGTIVGEIAVASNEQASGIAQINDAIEQVARITQSNTALAEESASASHEMSSQAQMLAQLVGKFNLKSSASKFKIDDVAEVEKVEEIEEEIIINFDQDQEGFGKY